MKIVELKQNGKDWYAWRGKGLGASDAPTVMGQSPWTTRFELWGQKVNILPREEPNAFALAAMKRGNELEPIARAKYVAQTGMAMEPVSIEHDVHACIRASLDGYNFTYRRGIEIKCGNKKDHEASKKGSIPDKYFPQMQQQMLITGDAEMDYVSYSGIETEDVVIVVVKADKAYQAALLTELLNFWTLVETKTPPSVGVEDLSKITDSLVKTFERLSKQVECLKLLNNALAGQGFGISGGASE